MQLSSSRRRKTKERWRDVFPKRRDLASSFVEHSTSVHLPRFPSFIFNAVRVPTRTSIQNGALVGNKYAIAGKDPDGVATQCSRRMCRPPKNRRSTRLPRRDLAIRIRGGRARTYPRTARRTPRRGGHAVARKREERHGPQRGQAHAPDAWPCAVGDPRRLASAVATIFLGDRGTVCAENWECCTQSQTTCCTKVQRGPFRWPGREELGVATAYFDKNVLAESKTF